MTSLRAAPLPTLAIPTTNEDALAVTCATALRQIDARQWDALVSRDVPHLRYEFLRAVEDSGFGRNPHYFCVHKNGRLVGVTVAYVLSVDLLTLAPPSSTRWIAPLRKKLFPRLLFLSTVTCGPIITNCNHNFFIDDDLPYSDKQAVIGQLIRAVDGISAGTALTMIEFSQEAADLFEPQMAANGFLRAPSLPGTRLDVKWENLDGYIAAMRKAFRRTVLKDRKAAENIDFQIVDDFTEIAEEAWALYANVLAKADHVFEKLTPEFFKELAKFDQSRLMTARDRSIGKLIGIELLLCGDTLLQDLYTGLDYQYNAEQRLYFNLLYPVIGFAGEQGFKTVSLGQTSYTFKARLGVQPYPLYIFVKHRNPVIHRLMSLLKGALFPQTPTQTFHVFRDEETPETSKTLAFEAPGSAAKSDTEERVTVKSA